MPTWRSIRQRYFPIRESTPPWQNAASLPTSHSPASTGARTESRSTWWSRKTMGGAGRRGARLGPHGNRSARKARGLEAALFDNSTIALEALAPGDDRIIEAAVAGVAALVMAKAHKLGERLQRAPG